MFKMQDQPEAVATNLEHSVKTKLSTAATDVSGSTASCAVLLKLQGCLQLGTVAKHVQHARQPIEV